MVQKIKCPVCGLKFAAKVGRNIMVECPKGCGYFGAEWAKKYELFMKKVEQERRKQ